MKTKRMKGMGDETPITKLEVLEKYPKIADALQQFAAETQAGSGKIMGSGSWWQSFLNWMKTNKIISSASKIASLIANATGFIPLGTALGAVAAASSAVGYGYVNTISKIGTKRKMKGKGVLSQTPSGNLTSKRLVGRGPIYSQNGMLVKQPTQSGGGASRNVMGGNTTTFNVVSTQPSKVAF